MKALRGTLLADGSSDNTLVYVISWVLAQREIIASIRPADLRLLRNPPRSLLARAQQALDLFPADVLFVHRDSEKLPFDERRAEILDSLQELRTPRVCVVPVRMTEAWFLFDARAIRQAAGNPNGQDALELPPIDRLEALPDPKRDLYELLRRASGAKGRRLRSFSPEKAVHRLAERIESYAPLRALPAFERFEAEVGEVCAPRE